MYNLNAFLKLRAKQLKKTNKELAKASDLSESRISRIFNHVQKINRIGEISPLLYELNLDKKYVQIIDQDFEKLFLNFINAVYYISDDRKNLYTHLQTYKEKYRNHPYYINLLLAEFIWSIISDNEYSHNHQTVNRFIFIYSSLSIKMQQIFLTFYIAYLDFKNNSHSEIIRSQTDTPFYSNEIEALYTYFLFSYQIFLGDKFNAYHTYQKCKELLQVTQNKHRLANLEIKYASLLNSFGFYQESIERNLSIIKEYQSKNYRLHNIPIIQHNIGFSYLLLNQYQEALTYFKKANSQMQDNEIYFEMAYCCYQLEDYKQAKTNILLGECSKSYAEYYYYLLEWLNTQLNKKYSKKAFDILDRIINTYSNQMQESTKRLILTEMMNYYRYNQEFEKACELLLSLSKNKLCTPTSLQLL